MNSLYPPTAAMSMSHDTTMRNRQPQHPVSSINCIVPELISYISPSYSKRDSTVTEEPVVLKETLVSDRRIKASQVRVIVSKLDVVKIL